MSGPQQVSSATAAAAPSLPELSVLRWFAGIGIVIGIGMDIGGTADNSMTWGAFFNDAGDLAAMVFVGAITTGAGFISLLAALVLSGVRRILERTPED